MKIGQMRVIEALVELDPATNGLVRELSIVTEHGRVIRTDSVTVDGTVVYARDADETDLEHLVAKDDIVGMSARFAVMTCDKEGVLPTIKDVLAWSRERD